MSLYPLRRVAVPGCLLMGCLVFLLPGCDEKSTPPEPLSWTPRNSGLGSLHIQFLAMHPADEEILFAGTWDGLYKSSNRSQSWTRVDSGWAYPQVSAIAIDAVDPDVIYAGTKGSGIFKSVDGGQTWQPKNTGLGDFTVWSIVTDPLRSDTVLAACETGIYRTYDGGDSTWSKVHWYRRAALAIDVKNSQRIFAAGQYNDFHKSTDGGNSWIVSSSQGIQLGGPDTRLQCVLVDRDDSQILYVGSINVGFYKSIDGGANWNPFNGGLNNRNVRAIGQDPLQANIIYLATIKGVFRSQDGGETWAAMNTGFSEEDLDIRALAVDPNRSEFLYVGTWDSGVFVWMAP